MQNDLQTIHASLQLLSDEKSEKLLSKTYTDFFTRCPEAESLWEKDDPVSRAKMFNSVILTVMDNITRPEICEKNLQSDIKDHDDYGVSKEMYGLFFCALITTLKEMIGDEFNQEMESAWRSQLNQIECQAHKYTGK